MERPNAGAHDYGDRSNASRTPLSEFADDAVEVWIEVRADSRPRHLARLVTTLTKPDFDVRDINESARIEDSGGHYRAHWRCRCAALHAVDEFAALRLLKRLTGAGFRILRFDNGAGGGHRGRNSAERGQTTRE